MKTLACVSLTCVLFASSISILAAPQQDGTAVPGQSTQARVWIQNRGAAEAVPVALQRQASDAPPLRVQVTSAPATTITGVVQTRSVRQAWEYRTLSVANGQDITALLNAAGTESWEASGIVFSTPNGTNVVMKRPR